MRSKVTVFFILLLGLVFVLNAAELQFKKPQLDQKSRSSMLKRVSAEEQAQSFASASNVSISKTNAIRQTAEATHLQVGTSGNGYGWLLPTVRSVGRFVGNDIDTGAPLDYLLVGFRGHGEGNADMAVAEVNLESGLSNGTLSVFEGTDVSSGSAANKGIDPWGSGARYPSVVALERPVICFNQFTGDVSLPNDPSFSHPYLITDYTTYGPSAGAWTTPDYLMDNGWLNPTLETFTSDKENRLWNGATSVVRDADGIYHWVGVYTTWYTDFSQGPLQGEVQTYGVQSEEYILNAHSTETDLSYGWTMGWDEGNDPVWIDTTEVNLLRWGVDMNSSGFGVIAGPGKLGGSAVQTYEDIRITYSTTNDFGLTWSVWDTVSMTDLGIPDYIYAADKIFAIEIVGTDTTWYEGPAFVGCNVDMSMMVDDNNSIWISFTSMWGMPGTDGWYPTYQYSGVLLAKKNVGQAWGVARIAYNNGIWVGDDDLGVSAYFFDNESQLSKDDQGNVYCAWLDRRRTGTQISAFAKYSDPDDNSGTIYNDYKTDIYASHSIDGGASWTQSINLTDTPSFDEYELNMALTSRNQDAAIEGDYGRIWVGYVLADTASGNPATDALIELSNAVWVAEGQGFNDPSAVSEKDAPVAEKFALHQNYPNPFNPTTRIEVVPVSSGHTTLTVYSLTGQKIQTLFDGEVTKGNPFTVDFDGTNIAAGVYFYTLRTGQNVEVKKMALIK